MVEFIFDLQRFGGGDGGGSSSGASGGGTGGSSSGGSNAKTDGDNATAAAEIWSDDWKGYSTKVRSALATEAYSLAQTVTPTEYVATEYADTISVSGHVNNIISNVNRFDTVKFVDLNLESFATFYNYTDYNNYVDLIFDTYPQTGPDTGTVTRLYLADSNFTPVLSFASGLNVVYNFDTKTWFGSDEVAVTANFWSHYLAQAGSVFTDSDGTQTAIIPGETITAVAYTNNFITGVDWQDNVYLQNFSPAELTFTQKTDKGLAMTFSDGTGALVQYDGNFSPTFYFNDGTTLIYNSKMGAWRTVDEAWADAGEYATAELQTASDKAAIDVNFNVIYDVNASYVDEEGETVKPWDKNTAFPASRWTNTEIYGTTLTNDIYFNDAVSSNVVDVIHEDDSHFNIVFDTGAVTRIEYADIVSPVLHFADGDYVFDNSIKKQSTSVASDFAAGFIPVASGSIKPADTAPSGSYGESSSADLADDGLAVSYDALVLNPDGSGTYIDPSKQGVTFTAGDTDTNGQTIYNGSDGSQVYLDGTAVPAANTHVDPTHDTDNDKVKPNHPQPNKEGDPSYEYLPESFTVSRYSDGFINKVTAQDDIYLVDAAFANISDFNITRNYDIILNFDTGKQLRVRDESSVSPVFHFADGTSAAYNWIAGQWVGVTDVGDFNNGVTDALPVSSLANNFIRNIEAADYIYIPDANYADVADIYSNQYYTNITFNTGTNIAIRHPNAVKYVDEFSPLFIFADGNPYTYQGTTPLPTGGRYYDSSMNDGFYSVEQNYDFTDLNLAETADLSVGTNNFVWYAGDEDTVNFVDAASTNIVDKQSYGYYIEFTFDNGTTTTVDYWENRSPLFTFTDGVTYQYNYATDTWNSASGSDYTNSGSYSVVDTFSLDKNNNNNVSNVRENDLITFTNAASTDVVNISATRDPETYNDTITFTFNNGATTNIEYTSSYSPTIQFADGAAYQYYYSSYSNSLTTYLASVGTAAPDLFTLSKTTDNRVNNAGAADTVLIGDASYGEVTYEYISTSSYSPYIEFGFGDYSNRKYTYVYYNPDEGITPNIVFADGTSYQYNIYQPNSDVADNIGISRFNNSIVYYADDEDFISVVDAGIANVTDWGDSYNAKLTFDTGKTALVGQYDDVSPLFLFADGQIRAYVDSTRTWGTPIFATDAADNIPLSSTVSNIVCNAASNDTIYIVDAARANIKDVDAVDDGNLSLTFDNGASTTVTYTGNVTPVIALTDGTLQYNVYDPTYDADTFDLSRNTNNIVHSYVREDDTVNFTDAAISNVTATEFDSIGWDIEFTFDTGKTTYVEFDKSAGVTPTFNFTDGSYRYITSYSSEAVKDVWQKYDTVSGTWQTTSEPVLTVYSSADLAESADLWGDTVDDNLFVDGTIAVDATLSDLVAAPVDNAAISFNAETAFDLNAAGGFVVASTATDSSQKTA